MRDISLDTVRKTLIAIAMDMRDPSQDIMMVQVRLTEVKRLLINNRCSLASIVFYGFAAYLGDAEVKREPEIIDTLREKLERKRGYWNTYVFKENMLSAMRAVHVEVYQILKRLVVIIEAAEQIGIEHQEEVDTIMEAIFTLKEEYQPETVGELMIGLAAQVLSVLPSDFRAVFHNDDETLPPAVFSGLYQGQIQRSEQLDYVQK